jgi:hypothetical protein
MSTKQSAIGLAALYPVFPCSRKKRPAFSNAALEALTGRTIPAGMGGCKIASQKVTVVDLLFDHAPKDCLIGVHTESLVCIDYDAYKGEEAAAGWVRENTLLCTGRVHSTQNGGTHFVFRKPEGMKLPSKINGIDSIDIKAGVGSYFIWPTDGSGYEVVEDREPPLLPQELADAIGVQWTTQKSGVGNTAPANSSTDAALEAMVKGGGDYHAALCTLTMRWANRAASRGVRLIRSDLMGQCEELLRHSNPNDNDRRERLMALLQDVGGELTRICDSALEKSGWVDEVEEGLGELFGAPLDSRVKAPVDAVKEERPAVKVPERSTISSMIGSDMKMPPRQWLHGHYMIAGHMTMTAAPGGTGKSTAVMTELLEIAAQKQVTGQRIWRPVKVLYINGEDPKDEIERKIIATALHHQLDPKLIDENFVYYSGRDFRSADDHSGSGLKLVVREDRDAVPSVPDIEALRKVIEESGAEIVCIDPLSSFHDINENDNSEVRSLMNVLRAIADDLKVSFHMVHHSVKEALGNRPMGHEQARGASAFLDACRIVRTMRGLMKEENVRLGLDEKDRSVIKVTIGKGNLVPRGEGSWAFRMQGFPLDNGDEIYPDGDNVGVIEAIDAGQLTEEHIDRLAAQVELAGILSNIDSTKRFRVYKGSGPRHADWIGHCIMGVTDSFPTEKALDTALEVLERDGLLSRKTMRDNAKGRDYEGYLINYAACAALAEMAESL